MKYELHNTENDAAVSAVGLTTYDLKVIKDAIDFYMANANHLSSKRRFRSREVANAISAVAEGDEGFEQ